VVLVGAEYGILLEPTLEPDHRSTVVFIAHLPEARVTRQHHEISAAMDVGFDRIALRRRPVLVVTYAKNE
jgi:hypothetical protein